MCERPNPLYCIVPPHILRALLAHPDSSVSHSALRTLLTTTRLRERRRIIGGTAIQVPAGTRRRTIYDARHDPNEEDLPGTLVWGEGDPASTDAAVNEAYDGLGSTYKLYKDIYQRNSIDDRGMRLDASVHYGQDYDNAFWDGKEMVFGDGDGIIFVGFTKAIDVIGHELTHGVTEHTANLTYHNQPGALNESVSDVFGSLVKQYAANQTASQADWLIGNGILAPGINGKALRSMAAPGTAYDDPKLGGKDPQPATMSGYQHLPDDEDNDFGGVHINSGIPNHAFYLLATGLGGYAWNDAGHIWYATLRQLWATANFQDCANVSYQVAGTLYGSGSKQQQAVRDAWSHVGIQVKAGAQHFAVVGRENETNGAQLKERLEQLSQELRSIATSIG
jgi:Zn-dependent metalloprotease